MAPDLRREVEASLAREEPQGWVRSGRELVASLLNDGSLVRVRVSGHSGETPLFALRGHATLLDLGALAPEIDAGFAPGIGSPPDAPTPSPAPDVSQDAPPSQGADLVSNERLFQAMERAQAMQAASGAGSDLAASLADVMEMIEPYLPGHRFYLELFPPYDAGSEHARVFHADETAHPFWAQGRVEGQAIWIPSWSELPEPLRRRAVAQATGGTVEGLTQGVAVAVPLYPPGSEDPFDDDATGEAGLLYVLSDHDGDRNRLLRMGTACRVS